MFKKTMTFEDLEGESVTQTFYFNYTKKEIAELLEFGYLTEFPPADPGRRRPLEEQLKLLNTPVEESGLSETDNTKQAYDIFQDLILDAYGEKVDNVSFDKNEKLRHYFRGHVAFVEIIFEFIGNPDLGAFFVEKCLPPKMVAEAKAEMQKENDGKLTSASLSAMVEEAAERQKDPATRIEPGVEAANEALGENPTVLKLAESIKAGGEAPEKKVEDLTEEDILAMDEDTFNKLDIRLLNREQTLVAFRRKTQV